MHKIIFHSSKSWLLNICLIVIGSRLKRNKTTKLRKKAKLNIKYLFNKYKKFFHLCFVNFFKNLPLCKCCTSSVSSIEGSNNKLLPEEFALLLAATDSCVCFVNLICENYFSLVSLTKLFQIKYSNI